MTIILQRLIQSTLSLLAVSILCFALMRAAPGDYYSELRLEPNISEQSVRAMEAQSDLHMPIGQRYILWCRSAIHGDFGNSLTYHLPVALLLRERIGNTLLLGATGLLCAWILGLVLGAISGPIATPVRILASGLWSIPEPVLALLILLLALRLHLLAPISIASNEDFSLWAQVRFYSKQMALPALALTLGYLPVVLRHVHRGLESARTCPAVEAAQAHGFPPLRILLHYVLPEAANPLISLLGLGIGSLLSASLFVEVLFGWPGLGQLLLNAILARDTNIVVAGVLCSAIMLITGNLLADLLLWWHDPRLRNPRLSKPVSLGDAQ